MEHPVAEAPAVIRLLTQSVPSLQKQAIEQYFTPSASFTHPFCHVGSFPGSRWLVVQVYRWYKIMSPGIELDVKSTAFDAENLIFYATIDQTFRIWTFPFYSAPVRLTTLLKLVSEPEAEQQQPPLYSPSPRPRGRSDRHIQFQQPPTSPLSIQTNRDDTGTNGNEVNGLPSPRGPEHPPAGILSATPQQSQRRLYYIASQEDLYQTSEFIKFVVPFGIGATVVAVWQLFATCFCILGVLVLWPVVWAEEQGYMPWKGQGPRNVRSAEEISSHDKAKEA